MITKKQWQDFLKEVHRHYIGYLVTIHGNEVVKVDLDNSLLHTKDLVKKEIAVFSHSSCNTKSLNEIYYMTKVKTRPENMLNTTLGKMRNVRN